SVSRFIAVVLVVLAHRLTLVLFELSLKGPESDPERFRRAPAVAACPLQGREDRLALDLGHRLAHERRDGDGLLWCRRRGRDLRRRRGRRPDGRSFAR